MIMLIYSHFIAHYSCKSTLDCLLRLVVAHLRIPARVLLPVVLLPMVLLQVLQKVRTPALQSRPG